MLKFLSLTALASAFVLATVATAPVSAGHFAGRSLGGGGGHPHYYTQRHISRPSHPHYIGRLARLHDHDRDRHHHFYHWRHGSHGWVYGVPVVAGVAAYEASGPAPVCTCLVKEYLDDGAVRFTDTCTKETAIALPPVPAPHG